MINIIWATIMVLSVVYSFFAGTTANVCAALFESAKGCVDFIIKTGSVMIMWSGFMNIAAQSGLTKKLSRLMSPVIGRVFCDVKKGSEEERLICSNLCANMLGLANAATPLGIKAMKKLGEKSRFGVATNDMCILAVINCASIQLVPSTLIGMRVASGSCAPADITVPIWITSSLTVIVAIVFAKIFQRLDKNV